MSPGLETAQGESDTTSNPKAPASHETDFAPGPPTLPSGPGASVVGSATVAVVDTERVFAGYQPGSDSQEVRSNALRDIKRIAAAHNYGFVFNLSTASPSGAPFVLGTNGVPDITDEILQELSQRPGPTNR